MHIAITEDQPQVQSRLAQLVVSTFANATVHSFGSLGVSWQHAANNVVTCWLIDIGLPDGSGIDLIKHLSQVQPQCSTLVVSAFEDPSNILAALEAGAGGYLLKGGVEQDLTNAMQALFEGGTPLSPVIASKLLARLLPTTAQAAKKGLASHLNAAQASESLSVKEKELLELLARGYSYQECADLMAVKLSSVQTWIKRVYAKLAVNSKTQAVFEAKALGLIER